MVLEIVFGIVGVTAVILFIKRSKMSERSTTRKLKLAMEEATFGTAVQIDEMDIWESRAIGLDMGLKKLIFLDFHGNEQSRNLIDLSKIVKVQLQRDETSIYLCFHPLDPNSRTKSICFYNAASESQIAHSVHQIMAAKWYLIIQNVIRTH